MSIQSSLSQTLKLAKILARNNTRITLKIHQNGTFVDVDPEPITGLPQLT